MECISCGDPIEGIDARTHCPECGGPIVRASGCESCLSCGLSRCAG